MFVNAKVTVGLCVLIWKLGCLITFKTRHKAKEVLLTDFKWKENIPESTQEATIRNNKVSFKPKGPKNGLFHNCTAVNFNKENAYILLFIFMMSKVKQKTLLV